MDIDSFICWVCDEISDTKAVVKSDTQISEKEADVMELTFVGEVWDAGYSELEVSDKVLDIVFVLIEDEMLSVLVIDGEDLSVWLSVFASSSVS